MIPVDCISIWKFEAAPLELRAAHAGNETPAWLALVPAGLRTDFEPAMQLEIDVIAQYETPHGDLILTGRLKSQKQRNGSHLRLVTALDKTPAPYAV